eukprot:TRINITY_DN22340_c0_g1_i2.p1 TRINITY_DN22340_c0_g1~~TRINITY_DN22340_c0_g1_i2.p1  ORF type:complete len:185 (+),score=29.89 TRINITY_DN22340_c0_g1_i2:109-663(+)
MIRRPPRSTLSSSSAASDVYKRQGQKLAVAGRGPGVWPSAAVGQTHPLAHNKVAPATIPCDKHKKDTPAEHEHVGHGHGAAHKHHEQGHGHSHGGAVPAASARTSFAVRAELNQRAAARANRAIPQQTERVPVPATAGMEYLNDPGPEPEPCYVINYAQPASFYLEQQQKRQQGNDLFWFKYSI